MRRLELEESPIMRAKRLFRTPLSMVSMPRKTRDGLRRIETKLTKPFVQVLDREGAPLNVCRWIAWGKLQHDRVLRTALALWWRRPVNPLAPGKYDTEWSWGTDPERAAAETLFRSTLQHAALVRMGLLPERPDQDSYYKEWDALWPSISKVVAELDRDEFTRTVKQLIKSRKKRKPQRRIVRTVSKERSLLADLLIQTGQSILRGGEVPESLSKLIQGAR